MRVNKRKAQRWTNRSEPPNFLGQHFMHNKKVIQDIVTQANVSRDDTVLELGAGKGALTIVLNELAGKVLAIEYDENLVNQLRSRMLKNTKVIQQDIMKLRLPKEKFIVVSNIPYAITTFIMKLLLSHPNSGLQRGVIVMEKGAAKRFTSDFIKDAYVLVWRMWFDIQYVRNIGKDSFSPPPKVDSALVKVNRRREPPIALRDGARFKRFAAHVLRYPYYNFDHALMDVFTPRQMKHLRRNLNIHVDTPVGALNETQWGGIFESMIHYVPRIKWP